MKVIKSKLIQKAEGKKTGKYHITLEVSDYDIEMFEDFALTYAPFEEIQEPSAENNWEYKYSADMKDKYLAWMNKTWRCFWKLWDLYDDDWKIKKK